MKQTARHNYDACSMYQARQQNHCDECERCRSQQGQPERQGETDGDMGYICIMHRIGKPLLVRPDGKRPLALLNFQKNKKEKVKMVVDIEKLRDEKNGIEIADNIVCAGVIQALLYATQEVNRCLVFLHGADINAEKLVEEGLRVYGNDNMRFLCRDLKLQGDNMAKMASFILDRTEDLQTDEKETDFYAWAGKHANSHETIVDRIITQITDVLLPET